MLEPERIGDSSEGCFGEHCIGKSGIECIAGRSFESAHE